MATTLEHPAMTGTTYEYLTVSVPQGRLGFVTDTYDSFGWAGDGSRTTTSPTGQTTLNLKRDRHIKNRPLVAELQRKAETALAEIDRLERAKTSKASITAFSVGIIGAAALAGSIFTFQAGAWFPFVLLGLIGIICWVVPYFAYNRIKTSAIAAVTPAINQQYDTVYDACEQARELAA